MSEELRVPLPSGLSHKRTDSKPLWYSLSPSSPTVYDYYDETDA